METKEGFKYCEIQGLGDRWLYKQYDDGRIEFRDELEPGAGYERFLTAQIKEQIKNKIKESYLTEDM
jgi:hypothetical protein